MAKRYQTLSEYLAKSGETQAALADRIGVTQSTISEAAAGYSISLSLAKSLSQATGVPVDSFGNQAVA